MNFLAGMNSNDILVFIVIAIIIVIIGLLIYYYFSSKKMSNTVNVKANFETKKVEDQPKVEELPLVNNAPVSSEATQALEEEKTSNSIAILLEQMQADLNKEEETVEKYESDQEQNAIISYKELMKLKNESALAKEKSAILEPKTPAEIKEVIKAPDDKVVDEAKKFKKSEFISPIFGRNDGVVTYREIKRPPRKEEKPNIEKLELETSKLTENDGTEIIDFSPEVKDDVEEINKNDKFLEALVDFRSKLN